MPFLPQAQYNGPEQRYRHQSRARDRSAWLRRSPASRIAQIAQKTRKKTQFAPDPHLSIMRSLIHFFRMLYTASSLTSRPPGSSRDGAAGMVMLRNDSPRRSPALLAALARTPSLRAVPPASSSSPHWLSCRRARNDLIRQGTGRGSLQLLRQPAVVQVVRLLDYSF